MVACRGEVCLCMSPSWLESSISYKYSVLLLIVKVVSSIMYHWTCSSSAVFKEKGPDLVNPNLPVISESKHLTTFSHIFMPEYIYIKSY